MKSRIRSAIVLGLMLLFAGTTQKAAAQNDDVSLQSFYDELSPYGTWIQDPQYGYVWRPDVDQDEFRPYYTNGRWAMTEYGNTWVSNYDWGWAPFHYGRWIYNSYNQWVWLPDTVWGPAWVSWRSGGGYYGWAPLGPSISIGINIGRGGYRVPDMCWNFIPYSNIYYNSYPRYNYGRNRVYIQNTVIINNTYVQNNRTYYTGPRVDDIRRHTNQNVNVYRLNRSHNPGVARIENNRINIYQPQGRPTRDNSNAAPRNAVRGNISRETIDRNVTANRGEARPGRFDVNRGDNRDENNRYQADRQGNTDRSGNPYNRPQRSEGFPGRTNDRGEATQPNENRRPEGFGRNRVESEQSQRGERQQQDNARREQFEQRRKEMQQQQTDRQRVERQQQDNAQREQFEQRRREVQQQSDRQRAERQQQDNAQREQFEQRRREMQQQQAERQQRMERQQPQPSSPRAERMERPQVQQQRGNEQRGSGGGENRGGGRPSGGRPGRG